MWEPYVGWLNLAVALAFAAAAYFLGRIHEKRRRV